LQQNFLCVQFRIVNEHSSSIFKRIHNYLYKCTIEDIIIAYFNMDQRSNRNDYIILLYLINISHGIPRFVIFIYRYMSKYTNIQYIYIIIIMCNSDVTDYHRTHYISDSKYNIARFTVDRERDWQTGRSEHLRFSCWDSGAEIRRIGNRVWTFGDPRASRPCRRPYVVPLRTP